MPKSPSYYSSSGEESSDEKSDMSRSHSYSHSYSRSYSRSSSESEHETPQKRKRAKSAYQFFCDRERRKIHKEHPKWRLAETSKELGKRWKRLDERKKKRFEKIAKEERDR